MKKILFLFAVLSFSINSLLAQLGSEKAYDFTSSHLSVPDNASLAPTVAISVEAWIKADSWASLSWQNVIVSKDGWATGNAGYTLRAGANGTLSFNLSGAGVWMEVESGPVMATGKWYHVAGTFDGQNLRVYINGELAGTTPYVGSITQGNYELRIGNISFTSGGTRYFDGMIDEVRVWDTALSETDIKTYMCKHVTSNNPLYANLQGNWKMDTPGTVIDSSPNGNNGTVSGAVHVTSGAPIGDESLYAYGTNTNLTLDYMGVDSINVTSSTVNPMVHVYRIDGAPTTGSATSSINQMDNTHYYGVFTSGSSPYTMTYYYGTNPMLVGNETYGDFATRASALQPFWFSAGSTVNTVAGTLSKNLSLSQEIIATIRCPKPSLNVNGNVGLCQDDTLTIINSTPSPYQQWKDMNGPISGQTSNTLDVFNSGSYYIVINDGICLDSSNAINVTVNALPVVDFGTFPLTFCENENAVSLVNGTPIGGMYSGNGVATNEFNPTSAGAGIHTLYYTYIDGNGCSDIDSAETEVYQAPVDPTITQNVSTLCAAGGATTYSWMLNGSVLPGVSDSCITITTNGTYQVYYTGTNGCNSDTMEYTVNDASLLSLKLSDALTVTPNPTKGSVTITLSNQTKEAIQIDVLSMDGKLMFSTELHNENNVVDTTKLPAGVYIIRATSGQNTYVQRLIKN